MSPETPADDPLAPRRLEALRQAVSLGLRSARIDPLSDGRVVEHELRAELDGERDREQRRKGRGRSRP